MLSREERSRRYTRRYTRAQAIKDGILINLSGDFPECHKNYKWYPVACTTGVWGLMSQGVNNPLCKDDFGGIVMDLLNVSTRATKWIDSKEHLFQFTMTGNGEDRLHTLRAILSPGDCCEPVITIMLQNE